MPPEHDVRHVLERDGDLPLVVRARRHRARARDALGALDEGLVRFFPRLERRFSNVLARRREVVAAVPRDGGNRLRRPLVPPPARDRAPALVDGTQRRLRPPFLVRVALVEVHLLGVEVGADVDREVVDVAEIALARHNRAEPRRQVALRVRVRLHEHRHVGKVVVVVHHELQVHAALVPVVGHETNVLGTPTLVHRRHRVPPRARRVGEKTRVLRVVRPHGHLGKRVPLVVMRHDHSHGRAPSRGRVVLGVQGDELAARRGRLRRRLRGGDVVRRSRVDIGGRRGGGVDLLRRPRRGVGLLRRRRRGVGLFGRPRRRVDLFERCRRRVDLFGRCRRVDLIFGRRRGIDHFRRFDRATLLRRSLLRARRPQVRLVLDVIAERRHRAADGRDERLHRASAVRDVHVDVVRYAAVELRRGAARLARRLVHHVHRERLLQLGEERAQRVAVPARRRVVRGAERVPHQRAALGVFRLVLAERRVERRFRVPADDPAETRGGAGVRGRGRGLRVCRVLLRDQGRIG